MPSKPKHSAGGQRLVRARNRFVFKGCPAGTEPRPMFFDFKDVTTLKRFVNAQGRLLSRKRTGLSAAAQRALATAVKRARFMALLPYVGD